MPPATFADSSSANAVARLHPVELPMYESEPLALSLRLLAPSEDNKAIAWAREFAKGQGAQASEDDPIYSRGLMAARLARACVARGSDADAPTPFFSGANQILESHALGQDRIAYLYELYEIWQDEVSPLDKIVSPEKAIAHAEEVARSLDPRPFVRLRPGMRLILHRSMALELVTLRRMMSLAGGTSASAPSTSSSQDSTSSPKPPNAKRHGKAEA